MKSLFNKVTGLEGLQLYQKETPTQVFSCKYYETFKNSFFIEHFRWLLLCKAAPFDPMNLMTTNRSMSAFLHNEKSNETHMVHDLRKAF